VRPIYFHKKSIIPVIILGYLIVAFIAISPILVAVFAGSIAESHGCKLDEGSVHPCIIAGTDWGDTLYTMGVMGWFSLLSMPLGFVLFIIWTIKVVQSLSYPKKCVRFTLNDYSVLQIGKRTCLQSLLNQNDKDQSSLRVFFLNKKEEQKIQKDAAVTVEGLMQRDNIDQAHLLIYSRVINDNQPHI